MSAHDMKPIFTDIEGYRRWRGQWRKIYFQLSEKIRTGKLELRTLALVGEDTAKHQKELHYQRAMAWKLMGLVDEAKERWRRIIIMHASIAEQNALFPLEIADCRTVDFHFNKVSLEYPDMPRWVVKTKGKTFYVSHVTAQVPWSTRETPDGSTKGMIRLRDCTLRLTAEGEAIIGAFCG